MYIMISFIEEKKLSNPTWPYVKKKIIPQTVSKSTNSLNLIDNCFTSHNQA